ncbi:MAG: hypothetical protein ACPL5F_12875 [Moorellaceae bacterium]
MVEAQCYLCPRECGLELHYDEESGAVVEVRRKGGTSAGLSPSCSMRKNVIGKHKEVALAILRAPRTPRVVVGGH